MVRDDRELRELVQALSDLDLTYHRVRGLLQKEISKHQNEDENPPSTPPSLFPGYFFKVGDRVKIKNPRLGQQNQGIIVGRTGKDEKGFIKIQTQNQKIINRGPQNLELV